MKILMLTPYLPFPLWSGGQIRTYNLLKHLSKKHEITLFSFIRNENERDYIPKLMDYCVNVEVFLKRPPWSLTSLSLSAVTFYPLVVCMYLNRAVSNAIAIALEHEHFDLIHAETFYVMPNIPKNNIPKILVEQTIEYQVYQHYTKSVKYLPLKILMSWDVQKIRFWEERFWQKASLVVAMSQTDKEIMQKLVKGLRVSLVPNGVDTDFFRQKKHLQYKKSKTVLFVGNFKWLQNREAVSMLVKDIWPKIISKLPDVKLWIVGKFPIKETVDFASPSITVSDDIDDIRKAYLDSDVLLAPIYGPGGTRYKILESMATGLPVVTTQRGCEGLDVLHGKHVLIGEDPKALAENTIKLLTNPTLYYRLVVNGRKLVETNFNWESIASILDKIYLQAAQKN